MSKFKFFKPIFVLIPLAILWLFSCEEDDEPLETQGSVTGTVTEAGSNKPIDAAEVTLSGISQSYKTGDDGKFEIVDIPEDMYTISVKKPGYKENKKQVSVRASYITNLDFSLEKATAKLKISPTSLDFGDVESEKTLLISNVTQIGTIIYKAKAIESWIKIIDGKGTIAKSETGIVKVSVSRINLSAGKYNGTVVVKSNQELDNYKLTIINRWGNKLYESHSLSDSWDGKYNDKKCSTSTYFYIINYSYKGQRKIKKGFVYLF